jgi:hypothetical protein
MLLYRSESCWPQFCIGRRNNIDEFDGGAAPNKLINYRTNCFFQYNRCDLGLHKGAECLERDLRPTARIDVGRGGSNHARRFGLAQLHAEAIQLTLQFERRHHTLLCLIKIIKAVQTTTNQKKKKLNDAKIILGLFTKTTAIHHLRHS